MASRKKKAQRNGASNGAKVVPREAVPPKLLAAHELARAIDSWRMVMNEGDTFAGDMVACLTALSVAADTRDRDALRATVLWARRFLTERVGPHPYAKSTEAGRRFVALATGMLESARGPRASDPWRELRQEKLAKDVALKLGLALWEAIPSGLVPRPANEQWVPFLLRITKKIQEAARRDDLDGRRLALAALRGWGLTDRQAQDALKRATDD